MKQRIILLMLVAACILTCGCKQETDDFETLPNAALGVGIEKTPETEAEEVKPHEPPIKEIVSEAEPFFEDLDFDNALFMSDQVKVDYWPPARTYSELTQELDYDNGIIVAGYAHGLRKRFPEKIMFYRTETTFRVEQVYYGTLTQTEITIIEPYYPVMKGERLCIQCSGYEYSMLKNHQKVLMFLCPTNQEGVYFPVYYELPLPEDYQDYDETAQKELLDFYRGKKEAYPEELRHNTQRIEKEIIEFPDGTVQEQYYMVGSAGPVWPERNISDEALLEEMRDHILIRLATDFKIKLWPKNHLRFSSKQDRPSDEGIRKLSEPE